MNGTEILINQLLKSLKIDPEQFKNMAGSIGQTVINLKSQLDRIEANQERILRHLNISETTAEIIHLETGKVEK